MEWATALRQIRQEGFFTGGIGIYYNFIHIDTRLNARIHCYTQ